MDLTLAQALEQNAALRAELEQERLEKAQLRSENAMLRRKVDWLVRKVFGGKQSETLSEQQLELLMSGLETSDTPTTGAATDTTGTNAKDLLGDAIKSKPSTRKGGGRRALPSDMETIDIVCEPPEVTQTPGMWKKIGEEITEELDIIQSKVIRRRYIRPKYVRATMEGQPKPLEEDNAPVLAPMPPRLLEKSMAGPGLLLEIMMAKYDRHEPLYRQEKYFREMHGLKLPRQLMDKWMLDLGFTVMPVAQAVLEEILASHYMQVDETPIRCLDPLVQGKSVQGYLWPYCRPGVGVYFDWQMSRGREGPERILKDFLGVVQADGYGVYSSLAQQYSQWILAGCMAHARRNFDRAKDEDPRRAGWVLYQMHLLYDVETRLREQGMGPRGRQAARAAESLHILNRIHRVLEQWRPMLPPQTQMAQAIDYTLERWESLLVYVHDGRVEIDNNRCENAIRPTAVGKKNWLFFGSPEAGKYNAAIYTLIGSCRCVGINPWEYLRDLFEKLPRVKDIKECKELTPLRWKTDQKKKQQTVLAA